ncbi:2-dehydro-3-deoxy-L-rhamnonate dehydrogenase (NAD(+)) [bioreactor metagenome]|uniref:2-dehydro-3-deoxy-L-rhamnonate dehydrogenase (NAD(+)) n=1 Tax=bioreactor metagenome TaxID=1076179 RepID=A0A645DZV0_9ZZZZ
MHAVRESRFKTGDRVLVIGAGPIGMLTAFVLRISGASKVFMIEPNEERYKFAKNLGFKAFRNEEELKDELPEGSADLVFEAVGIGPTMDTAVKYCRIKGQIVVVGVFKKPIPVELQRISFCEIGIIGVRVYRDYDFVISAQMLADHPEIGAVITHRMPFEEAKQAFLTIKKGGPAMKLLLHP